MKRLLLFLLCGVLLLVGCSTSPSRIKGGSTSYRSSSGSMIQLMQSEDPKEPSKFNTEIQTVKEYILPTGTVIVPEVPVVQNVDLSNNYFVKISSNVPVKITTTERTGVFHGASQKDTTAETAVKLSSMRFVQIVGVLLLLFGVVSFAWPPLRLVIGSVSTSCVVAACGILLVVLPVIVVGNEILILLSGLGLSVGYFFIHRYGKSSGENRILKQWVDKNNDGKVQPNELV